MKSRVSDSPRPSAVGRAGPPQLIRGSRKVFESNTGDDCPCRHCYTALAESRPASPSARHGARRPRLAGLAARATAVANLRRESRLIAAVELSPLAAASAAPTWAPGQVRARGSGRVGLPMFTEARRGPPRPRQPGNFQASLAMRYSPLVTIASDRWQPSKSLTSAGPQRTGLLARSGWQPVSGYACCGTGPPAGRSQASFNIPAGALLRRWPRGGQASEPRQCQRPAAPAATRPGSRQPLVIRDCTLPWAG